MKHETNRFIMESDRSFTQPDYIPGPIGGLNKQKTGPSKESKLTIFSAGFTTRSF